MFPVEFFQIRGSFSVRELEKFRISLMFRPIDEGVVKHGPRSGSPCVWVNPPDDFPRNLLVTEIQLTYSPRRS